MVRPRLTIIWPCKDHLAKYRGEEVGRKLRRGDRTGGRRPPEGNEEDGDVVKNCRCGPKDPSIQVMEHGEGVVT